MNKSISEMNKKELIELTKVELLKLDKVNCLIKAIRYGLDSQHSKPMNQEEIISGLELLEETLENTNINISEALEYLEDC